MIHNMTGGGAGLNLKVVGNPQPTSPAENTIWVNTDTEINGYAFSATEPENPTEGMVWFATSVNSTVPIDIDKENTVMLYPLSCHQYINGAWVVKTAQTYQNGAWKSWRTYLYNKGDECTELTGGWTVTNTEYSTGKKETTLFAKTDSSGTYGGRIRTVNRVDLTNANTLGCNVTAIQNGGIQISINQSTSISAITYLRVSAIGEGSVDVSNLTGTYYIWFSARPNTSGYNSGEVSQIWIE